MHANRTSLGNSSRRPDLRAGLLAWLLLTTPCWSADPEYSDVQVKTVYIYNFASFVRWPESALAGDQPFLFCTSGHDEVVALLPQVIAGERLGKHPMQLRALRDDETSDHCHILYLADAPPPATASAGPVLRVSARPGFAAAGGHIELGVSGRRVRPIINRTTINASGLSVSAQLYRLATVIETPAEAER